ncbi:(deoxy)nucleoside triphosphate pyrophosphohydrolase [Mucilaginibacter sabulilitoris]|uniref:8-oxo-dGTP diphosphatase n=1 Tax=Mucilaginibacter sabulilitoris TaxID=1173583 RepID=A0ABZ0TFF3_9SPHI|nr:(deoxy)nucleoside triphosphate pyrophosphohydrolase [Mucilaginibacter sabulilitoris]WPU91531.1 (deoxy)nucleoside triphosphate pyrophosphohydrolase [Mucilaginibacter sabulilitoris]
MSKPNIIPVAAAVIFKEGQLLIARRAAHKSQAGFWEFPGGKIEVGETPEACLLRELKEELAIEVKVNHFLMESIHHYDQISIVLKAYHCSYLNGDIQLHDHDLVEWISLSEFDQFNFAPADRPFLPYLISIQ